MLKKRLSKRNGEDQVTFEHQSDYSIGLTSSTVDSWWRSHVVFKIYARAQTASSSNAHSMTPTLPTLVGIARLSLRYVLKSRNFKLAKRLAVKDVLESTRRVGTLHVSIELTSELKEFATGLGRLRASEKTSSRRSGTRSPAPLPPSSTHPTSTPPPPLPPQQASSTSSTLNLAYKKDHPSHPYADKFNNSKLSGKIK